MDTRNVKGTVLDFDVLALNGADIKSLNEQEFCQVAVRLERIIDATNEIGVSVAEYVHAFLEGIIAANGGYPYDVQVIERDFVGRVAGWSAYLTSAAAGEYQVEALPNSINQAERKLVAGIKRNADFRVESSCSKVAGATSKFNKAKEAQEKAANIAKFQDAVESGQVEGGVGGASAIEVRMAALAKQFEAISELDKDRAADKLSTLEGWASETLSELSANIGDAVVNG